MIKIAVLVSGGGTNLQALIDAQKNHTDEYSDTTLYSIAAVISDTPNAFALQRAQKEGIATEVVTAETKDRAEKRRIISDAVLHILKRENIDAVVLAGFLTVLTGSIIDAYGGRIINLHPALLPKFGGVGMYGDNVHRAVLASGEAQSGCTVHLVDSGCDTGSILLQRSVPVCEGDTIKTLAQRIHIEEHIAIVDGTVLLAKRLSV